MTTLFAPPDLLDALVPASLRSVVEARLRREITGGALAPGAHLSDRLLCERYGVSRTVVREAIRALEAEGLVTIQPHRGPFVARLTAAEAEQIYEVRAALEALAGEGFAIRATEPERAALRQVLEALETDGPTAGREALLEYKRRFYAVLLRGCRNEYAARMLGLLLNRNAQLRATSLSAPDRLPDTLRELRRIVGAIDRRDGKGAAKACREHVRAAARVALSILRDRDRAEADAGTGMGERP